MPGFNKSERLCSRKAINLLFERSNILLSQNFKILWLHRDNHDFVPARIAISVPKRKFRKAVSRNLIKRRIKEIYRRNKDEFYEKLTESGLVIDFMIIFSGSEILKSCDMENEIILSLQRLVKDIRRTGNN